MLTLLVAIKTNEKDRWMNYYLLFANKVYQKAINKKQKILIKKHPHCTVKNIN